MAFIPDVDVYVDFDRDDEAYLSCKACEREGSARVAAWRAAGEHPDQRPPHEAWWPPRVASGIGGSDLAELRDLAVKHGQERHG